MRQACHDLLCQAVERIGALTGLPALYENTNRFAQMAIAPLPPIADLLAFKTRLYDEFHVEIPCIQWGERQFIRVSVQGYNTQEDIDILLNALGQMLPA